MGFIDLENGYDTVNREAQWQVLRMYDVGDKLLNGIKSNIIIILYLYCVSIRGVALIFLVLNLF